MKKKQIIEMLNQIRKEDKETIKELIRINERLSCEFKDIIRELQKYLLQKEENKKEME